MLKTLLLAAAALLVIAAVYITSTPRPAGYGPEISIGDLPDTFELPPCDERRVETPDQLEQVLRSDFAGCVVVAKDKFLNMTGRSFIPIKSGVSLKGERGELGSRPGVFTNAKCADPSVQPGAGECQKYVLFEIAGNNVSVTGLHLRGPVGRRSGNQPYVTAIEITADPDLKQGRGIYIAENEFDEWPGNAVAVLSTRRARTPAQYRPEWARLTREDASLIRVERNFIHHNSYGVNVGTGAFATIMGNVFDFNWHAVASNGFANSGYIARFNYVLEGGFKVDGAYPQHFDVHGTNDTCVLVEFTGRLPPPGNGCVGDKPPPPPRDNKFYAYQRDNVSTGYGGTAGDQYEVAYNAIRGAQEYYCFIICLKTRSALMLRGKPTTGMRFNANVTVHGNHDSAVSLKMAQGDWGADEDHDEFNFNAAGNQFSTDRSGDIATGDFDGDGRTDVFVATGTAWFFSRGGREAWEFLRASNKLTANLGFADIDNDGTTDVLYRDSDGNLGFLKSGRDALQPLTTTPEPMSKLRFGDFDGDGLTDIFYTRDRQWKVWYGSEKDWRPTKTSGYAVSDFLFGEFDAQKGTDVAVITGGKWKISSGSTGSWTELNSLRRSSFRGAVVADFNGDGRSDIAFDDGRQMWGYSPGGAGAMQSLREGDGQSVAYRELSRLLVGHFDGDPRAEVVSYYVPSGESLPVLTNHFMIWRGGRRDRFEQLSWHAMR
jgi:hypothetical protein